MYWRIPSPIVCVVFLILLMVYFIVQKVFAQQRKQTINKIKRQPTKWENIFANISDKGLISKIYKELTNLNTKKHPITKMGKGPEQTLLQRGHTDGQQTDEKMLSITSHQRDTN